MGLISWLFGGSSSSKDKNDVELDDLTFDDDLHQQIAAENAALAQEKMDAAQVVRDHENGIYPSWEDAKMKNPHVRETLLEEAANMHWQHPKQKDRFR